VLWQEFEPRTVRTISKQALSCKYAPAVLMRLLSYILISRKTPSGFSVAVLVQRTAPPAYARSSVRVRWAACGNSLQVPTITLRHRGETKTVIKKLPDDSSKTAACSLEHCSSRATLRTCVSSAENSTGKGGKCTLVQAPRPCTGRTARRGSRGIALPFHDHGTRRGWGVSVTRWTSKCGELF
jgi:hypothetical protein